MKRAGNALGAALSVAVTAALCCSVVAQAGTHPQALVEDTTQRVLERLKQDKELLKQQPERVYDLVADLVLPHFDFVRMSRWVLGRAHWQGASNEQKTRFVLAFRTLMVRTYATALLEYSDQQVSLLPFRGRIEEDDVVVRSEVVQPGAPGVAINYSLYRRDADWLVYDVSVDGVSLLTSYRSSFASEIRESGLEALIERLEQHNSARTS